MRVNIYFNRYIFKIARPYTDKSFYSRYYAYGPDSLIPTKALTDRNIPFYYLIKDGNTLSIGNNILEQLNNLGKDLSRIQKDISYSASFYHYLEELYYVKVAIFYINPGDLGIIVREGMLVNEDLLLDAIADGTVYDCPVWLLKYFDVDLHEPEKAMEAESEVGTDFGVALNSREKVRRLIQILKDELAQLESLEKGGYTDKFIDLKIENISKEINMVFSEGVLK